MTMQALTDGRYQVRLNLNQITAFGNPTNHLLDTDGTADGFLTDNFFRLQGDLNGDSVVNVDDRTEFLAHFGTKAGQSCYDFAADLNGDGIVNLLDYMLWLQQLNKTV